MNLDCSSCLVALINSESHITNPAPTPSPRESHELPNAPAPMETLLVGSQSAQTMPKAVKLLYLWHPQRISSNYLLKARLEEVARVSMAMSCHCLGDHGLVVLLKRRDLCTAGHSTEFPPSLPHDGFYWSSAPARRCLRWLCRAREASSVRGCPR